MTKKILKNEKIVKDVKNTKTKKEKIVDVLENQSNETINNENQLIEAINNETADLENQNAEPENNIDVNDDNNVNDNNVNDIELNDNMDEIDDFVENDLIENQTAEPINSVKEKPIIIKKEKKSNIIYDILSSEAGATLNELIEKTGWQKHSIRGTLSNLQKELQFSLLKIELSRPDPLNNKDFIKETRYFIKDADFILSDFLIKKQNETADLNLIDDKKAVNE